MPNLPHIITQDGVLALRQQVEDCVNRRIVTPADFDYLSAAIAEKTRLQVSATTLKRIWGYVRDMGDNYKPGRYTLCAMASFIGYRDYEDFIDSYNRGSIQSRSYCGETLHTDSLTPGDCVEVIWSPSRRCLLRYISGHLFDVIEAVNAKIVTGDRVECASFTQNAPLYFNRVIRAGEPEVTYVAGARTGVAFSLTKFDK